MERLTGMEHRAWSIELDVVAKSPMKKCKLKYGISTFHKKGRAIAGPAFSYVIFNISKRYP